MHEYTLHNHDRKRIYYFLAAVSGIISSALTVYANKIGSSVNLTLAAPSGIAIFGLLVILFENFLWKLPILYKSGVVRIPCLNGKWDAQIESSRSPSKKIPAVINIYQTYSKIRLRLETQKSTSFSLMAVIEMIDPNCFKVRWEYLAEYRPQGSDIVSRSYGVTYLKVQSDSEDFNDSYEAYYYTEPGTDTSGKILLNRVRNK